MSGGSLRNFDTGFRSEGMAGFRHNLLVVIVVSGLFLFGGLASEVTAVGTPTPTPTGTATPPRAPVTLVTTLKSQLLWGGAGGGFSDPGMSQTDCFKNLVTPKSLPAILPVVRGADEFGSLCLVGFSFDELVTIQFTSPNRRADLSGVFRRGEAIVEGSNYLIEQVQPSIAGLAAGTLELNHQGIPLAMIILWMPIGLPEGRWVVEARSGSRAARTTLDTTWPKGAPRLAWRYPQASILGRPPTVNIYARTGCNRARLDETIPIFGSGFKPFSTVPIGLYAVATGSELRGQTRAAADRSGNISMNFKAEPLLPPGDYAVVAALNLNSDRMDETGPIACIKTLEWKPCPDAPISRISPFFGLKSNPADPGANNIRSLPGLSGQILGKLTSEDLAFLLDGPSCADQMVWWKIRTSKNVEGWVSEGQGQKIFLLPAE